MIGPGLILTLDPAGGPAERKPRRIRTTGQAREARRQARLALINEHDKKATVWLLVGSPEVVTFHLDRMEHHLNMLEAGR